jgi:hypothetical protein
MANGLDLSAFVAPGVAVLRPTGRPTGAGGPEILGSDLAPALRFGVGVSRRAGRNLSIGLEVAYQYTARSEFDTSLPGERFERGGSNELRGGLRVVIHPDEPTDDWTSPIDNPVREEEKPKAPPADKPKVNEDQAVNEIDCIVVAQYQPDATPEEQAGGKASNADMQGSAEALKAKSGGEIKKVTSDPKKDGDLPDVITSFTAGGKKCCKNVTLIGHGYDEKKEGGGGAFQLPYKLEGAEDAHAQKLGGLTAKGPMAKAPNEKHYQKFVSRLKRAICKGGKDKPTVTFASCFSALEESSDNIAEQVSAEGIRTKGFTGVCEYVPGGNVPEGTKPAPTSPLPAADAKEKTFEPKKEDPKKKK